MEFTIPQFIEKDAKIVGPFTFKQFIFIGAGAGITVFMYFILPFFLFIPGVILIMGGAFALSFVKIEKTTLPIYISNFFLFLFKPRLYLWDKKTGAPKFLKRDKTIVKELKIKKEEEKGPNLKVSRGSNLDDLFTKLETK